MPDNRQIVGMLIAHGPDRGFRDMAGLQRTERRARARIAPTCGRRSGRLDGEIVALALEESDDRAGLLVLGASEAINHR